MVSATPRRVDLLGPVPPPYGGVSIHILRFRALLEAEGHAVRVLPYTGLTRSGKIGKALQAGGQMARLYGSALAGRPDVVHLHYGGLGYFLALAPLLGQARGRKVVTFHSVRVVQDLKAADAAKRRRALDLLAGFDLFVAVRAEIAVALQGLGVDGPAVTVMPAFLPPAAAEAEPGRLPAPLRAALDAGAAAGRLQVGCGAYYLGAGYGHQDIYGVEELAGALDALDGRPGPAADVWVLVSNAPDTPGRRRIDDELRRRAAAWRRFTLQLHYGQPLIPVLARASGFLRPSREDGDSVAIREALAFGLPVLASDVVARPEGVTTFRLGSGDGLAGALAAFLDRLPAPQAEPRPAGVGEAARYRAFVAEVVGA